MLLEDISIIALLHIVLMVVTIPRILYIKRDATAALAWLLGVLLMPIFGTILFWTLGDPEIRDPLRRVLQGPPIHRSSRRSEFGGAGLARFHRLRRILHRMNETPATTGNYTAFYTCGHDLFRDMIEAMRRAEKEICVQFFIFRHDDVGRRFAEVLEERAREGVAVYFLYDAVGSRSLPKTFLRELRAAGVQCHAFLPLNILRRRIQINFRNHRKLLLVDRRVAFTGGFNIGREYEGRSRLGEWFDGHVRIEGPAVSHLFEVFAGDWDFVSQGDQRLYPQAVEWLRSGDEGVTQLAAEPKARGWVQTISSGPDQDLNRVRSQLFFAATRARRRLWIATPYLVPDEAVRTALTTAALSGVDVRILTQNNRPDHWIPYWAARYFTDELLNVGVRIYQFQPGMMHAKMMLVDRELASVGSANLDTRSLALNFELNCVFYSDYEIAKVEDIFNDAFRRSQHVPEEFLRRRLPVRIIENFARLFAPIL